MAGPSPGRHTYYTHIVVVFINCIIIIVFVCCLLLYLLLLRLSLVLWLAGQAWRLALSLVSIVYFVVACLVVVSIKYVSNS